MSALMQLDDPVEQKKVEPTSQPAGEFVPSEAHMVATRFLISAMMMGQMHQLHDDAKIIHKSLSLMMGDGDQLRITMAIGSAMGGDAEPAKKLLEEGVDHWPDADVAKLSLSLALKLAGDPAWKESPDTVMSTSVDPVARVFASTLLEDDEHDEA